VIASEAPIVLLDGELRVVEASASFVRAFHLDPSTIEGDSLFALGAGEWEVPQLRSLLKATLSGVANIQAYEMDLKRPGLPTRCLVLTAHQLDHSDTANVRLLLTVSDVTYARLAERLKDDLMREKAVLFHELQHRVANSLQIIASVLMQTARRVPSLETRGHLMDAHSRVMSVAALQRQLANSGQREVDLKSYFEELCESIGASMIQDHDKLKLTVQADNSSATSDVSVSLGLIVTELVINALKHAFPDGRAGGIVVVYHATGPDWTLSVDDDGIGMPTGELPAKAGLGTSIVHALASQLGAVVKIAKRNPGTHVSVNHVESDGSAAKSLPAL
jgi:two-component sensor histidine kinase